MICSRTRRIAVRWNLVLMVLLTLGMLTLPLMSLSRADDGAASQPSTSEAGNTIAEGDHLAITVTDLQGPGVETLTAVAVDQNGNVKLPYLKKELAAKGLTHMQLELSLVKALREANLIQQAQVSVRPGSKPTTMEW